MSDHRDLRRIVVAAAAAAAAVVVGVVGVTVSRTRGGDDTSSPPTSPGQTTDADADFLTGRPASLELLEGVWRVDAGTTLVHFLMDGTVLLDSGGRLYANPLVGTYAIEGDVVTVELKGGPAGCVVGQQLAMRASQPEAGLLHVVHTRPVTVDCLSDRAARWVLQQVLPADNEDLAGLDLAGDDFTPLADAAALHGDWMAQGGGYVLELTSDPTPVDADPSDVDPSDAEGVYYVAAASGDVVDTGRWTVDSSLSRLQLLSTTESPGCDAGERLVLGELRYVNSHSTATFRGTVEENTCGGAWTPAAWILLPHERG